MHQGHQRMRPGACTLNLGLSPKILWFRKSFSRSKWPESWGAIPQFETKPNGKYHSTRSKTKKNLWLTLQSVMDMISSKAMKLIHCLTSPPFAQGGHAAAFERCGVHQKFSAAGQQCNTMPHRFNGKPCIELAGVAWQIMSVVLPMSPVVWAQSKTWWPISMSKTAGSTPQRGFWDASVPPCVLSQGGQGFLAKLVMHHKKLGFQTKLADAKKTVSRKVARINEPNHARTSVESQGSWFKEMTLKYWTACKEAKEHRETQDQISEASVKSI